MNMISRDTVDKVSFKNFFILNIDLKQYTVTASTPLRGNKFLK